MSGTGPTLSGQPVQRAVVHIPATGLWHLDVLLLDAIDPGTLQRTFVYQGLSLSCTVLRSIYFANARGLRLVAGMGGWRQTIPAQPYMAQLLLSQVVADAANLVGEPTPVLGASDMTLQAYVRASGPAVRVLDLVPFWYTDTTGTVQTFAPSTSLITSDFTLVDISRAEGKFTFAPTQCEDFMPGRTFQTSAYTGTITRVMHDITPGSVRTIAFGQELTPGLVAA